MFGIDKLSDIVDIGARLATAFATGGASELLRLATDLGSQVIDKVLQSANVQLPEPARAALDGYVRGLTQ